MSFAVTFVMMAAFVWGRYRYDLVAAAALLLALAVGIVPFDEAFSGFSDDIVVIVGSALLVSAGIARSGIMEAAIKRPLAPGRGLKGVADGQQVLLGLRPEHLTRAHTATPEQGTFRYE
ncbi:SLC13 family permease, partial [Mesorhizobium sp. M7A.F.Ca.US.011.01.1.1]|uniref:SLC13 family permease n=1 Tax=Mesorhizobium sp. M7A.F.Ca.US.011.01.1.1 TaxID=2496741 RepID=UPI0032AF8507